MPTLQPCSSGDRVKEYFVSLSADVHQCRNKVIDLKSHYERNNRISKHHVPKLENYSLENPPMGIKIDHVHNAAQMCHMISGDYQNLVIAYIFMRKISDDEGGDSLRDKMDEIKQKIEEIKHNQAIIYTSLGGPELRNDTTDDVIPENIRDLQNRQERFFRDFVVFCQISTFLHSLERKYESISEKGDV